MPFSSSMAGLVQRLKGTRVADSSGSLKTTRLNNYGDLWVQPSLDGLQGACEEGSFYVAVNPTPETPIAATTSIITYAETAGAVGVTMMLRNGSVFAETSKRIQMAYIRLMLVQVPTSATHWKYVLTLDDNPARYTSGGSQITTIFNSNGDVAASSSIATLFFGALTTAAPTNRRFVGRGNLRGVIPTTFDQYVISFGIGSQGTAASAAASGSFTCFNAPVTIAPGQNLCLTMWGIGNAAAPSWEFDIGWAEK
jgi:hypothetical protein